MAGADALHVVKAGKSVLIRCIGQFLNQSFMMQVKLTFYVSGHLETGSRHEVLTGWDGFRLGGRIQVSQTITSRLSPTLFRKY